MTYIVEIPGRDPMLSDTEPKPWCENGLIELSGEYTGCTWKLLLGAETMQYVLIGELTSESEAELVKAQGAQLKQEQAA